MDSKECNPQRRRRRRQAWAVRKLLLRKQLLRKLLLLQLRQQVHQVAAVSSRQTGTPHNCGGSRRGR